MLLKKKPVYRKAEKEDFPMIMDFIRKNYKDRWEYEENRTEKRLTKFLFYGYMICRDSITVATYRDQAAGVLITANKKGGHLAPIFRLKKGYHFLRLKLTREGRKNLEHLKQIQTMQQKLQPSKEKRILFFYVSKDYRRNGIGTGLLDQIPESERNSYFLYMDQLDHHAFMENYGFAKLNEVSRMRELNKKRFREIISLYQYGK